MAKRAISAINNGTPEAGQHIDTVRTGGCFPALAKFNAKSQAQLLLHFSEVNAALK